MIAAATSISLFLAIVVGAVVLFRPAGGSSVYDRRLRALRTGRGGPANIVGSPALRRPQSSIPALGSFLRGNERADSMALDLERANVRLRVGEYLLLRVLLGIVLFLIGAAIMRFQPVGILVGVGAAGVGYMLPAVYVRRLQRRRKDGIEAQLVEFSTMLASSLRSGFGFQQGVELASQQLVAPLADELRLLINDLNVGATMETALLDFGRRVGSPDVDMLVTAVLVQRTTGGNLAEVLDQTAETLRERERIRGDLRTLTTTHRLTGLVLSVWPIVVGLALLALMPSMWSLMFTETAGRVLLGIAFSLQVIGFLIMRRVMDVRI